MRIRRFRAMALEMYLNRTICDVLREMRKCCETGNYSYLPGLIEEAQSMGNKMEAKLEDVKDLKRVRENLKELHIEYNELYTKKEKLDE